VNNFRPLIHEERKRPEKEIIEIKLKNKNNLN